MAFDGDAAERGLARQESGARWPFSSRCNTPLRIALKSYMQTIRGVGQKRFVMIMDATATAGLRKYWFRLYTHCAFKDCAKLNKFCGCMRMRPPRGLPMSAMRKNEIDTKAAEPTLGFLPLLLFAHHNQSTKSGLRASLLQGFAAS